MWTRVRELRQIGLPHRMDLAKLRKVPAHWRELLDENKRLYAMEKQTLIRRRADLLSLNHGLNQLRTQLHREEPPPDVALAAGCPATDPRCSCPSCKWKRVQSNLVTLVEEIPQLLTPQPDAVVCGDCHGLALPSSQTVNTAAPICKACQRFRAILGPPPTDTRSSRAPPSNVERNSKRTKVPAVRSKPASGSARRRPLHGSDEPSQPASKRACPPTSHDEAVPRAPPRAAAPSSSSTARIAPGRGLNVQRTVELPNGTLLAVVRGCPQGVLAFEGEGPDGPFSAIVNAANSGCQGGGGVDGAITRAGGTTLAQARRLLPVLDSSGTRCRVGDAVTTVGGGLNTTHCVHAVGPNYTQPGDHDGLLYSAYRASLDQARQHSIETIAFALLSSGLFRNGRPLREVLGTAVNAIAEHAPDSLREVYLVAFDDDQEKELMLQLDRL
jgi:O-acetyl-ADP-ribose deacetylase (regulator of RNase III)